MNCSRLGLSAALATILLAGAVPSVLAQVRVEGVGALSVPLTMPRGLFTTDYEPGLIYVVGTAGDAGQTINLDSGREAGFEGGLNVLFTPRVGVQVLIGRETRTFESANSPYDLSLDYLARLPPDYIQRPYSFRRSFDWPDTVGSMTLWRLTLDGLARVPVGDRADLTLTGGLLLSRPSGGFEQAAYHEFRLGGHSTLFYNEALVSLRFAESWHTGFNGGAELAIRAGPRIAFTVGLRWLTCPMPTVDVDTVLNEGQMPFEISRDDVQAALSGTSAEFDRMLPVLRFGLRIF